MKIGIDPGYNGAIVFLEGNEIKYKYTIPLTQNGDVDFNELLNITSKIKGKDTIILEDVHSVFGASAKANFQFGRVCGILRAYCEMTGAEIILSQPKVWQSKVWVSDDIVMNGKKKNTKKTSLNCAKRLFPEEEFRKSLKASTPHDGLVDATLIAYSHAK